LGKKRKIGIIIIAFFSFYIFLIYSPELFTITPFVFTDKSEYLLGEKVSVYGFSIQPHQYTSGCDALLKVIYDSNNNKLHPRVYTCTSPVGYTQPMLFYGDVWDQKISVGYEGFSEIREPVEAGEYSLYYMNQKIPIRIVNYTE